MMDQNNQDPTLSPDEIFKITHRKRPGDQLKDLLKIGIPAMRRHDNTICVLRVDMARRAAVDVTPAAGPQRKSAKQ